MSNDLLIDTTAPGKNSYVCQLGNSCSLRADAISSRIFRIRYSSTGEWYESGLNRYGIIGDPKETPAIKVSQAETGTTISTEDCSIELATDGSVTLKAAENKRTSCLPPAVGEGFNLSFKMTDDERIYGLGDVSRENIMRRGESYELWVVDVSSYIPIPVIFSSNGWGMLLNTTWSATADIGKTQADTLSFTAARSPLDFYIFAADDMPSLLNVFTSFTGRPKLLPIWGYALTYVANENINAFEMMNEASKFRELGIPCDTMGLEPGWMSENYDKSIDKKWHPQRFPMPWWAPVSPHTFPSALKRLGFKLSLWLCCDYDLTEYEEKKLAGTLASSSATSNEFTENSQALEKDTHINPELEDAKKEAEAAAKAGDCEYWFKHLEKFVDQGADAFKLDGAWQVIPHPDRIYANGMDDAQMHNLYPVVYDRQMAEGFEKHTGRRAMVYSASGFTGIQQYVASWAGDTGGGPQPLASMLNLGICGHSNHSCDMDVFSAAGIHFGLLQTWAQLCNWAYWRQPWYLEPSGLEMYKFYAKLRYRLLPYIYSSAWQAHTTGLPVMRAMPLAFPNMDNADNIMTQYMLGDFFLVTAFTDKLHLPEGQWLDFWTGRRLNGPLSMDAEFPPDRGGCLLLKSGAIIPTWPEISHTTTGSSSELGLILNPGKEDSEFTLYEDDGISLEHQNGAFATTHIKCSNSTLTISPISGSFNGMPTQRKLNFELHMDHAPLGIIANGVMLDYKVTAKHPDDKCTVFSFEAPVNKTVEVRWL